MHNRYQLPPTRSGRALLPHALSGMKQALKVWPLRGTFALIDQGLISGSNFIVAVILARWLVPRQYGAYALAFEVFLFLSVIYGALILEPVSVFGPSLYKNDFPAYLSTLLRIHAGLSAFMLVAVFVAAGILRVLRPGNLLPDALMGVGIASPCLLLFWLARRGFYVHLLPQKAAMGAAIYAAVLLAGVILVFKTHLLSSLAVFLLMAAGALVAGPLMLLWFKRRLPAVPGARRVSLTEVARQHWHYGRWALGSSLVIFLTAAIYYPLLGSFFGLAETGKFKALMNLSSPIAQAFVALSLLSLPYASRVFHETGPEVSHRLAWKLTGLYLGGTSLYWLILILAGTPVVHHLYSGRYTLVIGLLPWLALGSIFRIAATAQAVVLRAMRLPKLVCGAYSAACLVGIVSGVPCTRWFGIRGALLSWILSSITAFAVAILMVQRQARLFKGENIVSVSPLMLRRHSSVSMQR